MKFQDFSISALHAAQYRIRWPGSHRTECSTAPSVFEDPEVVFESPLAGSITIPQPTIAATITGGDFRTQPIALEHLEATMGEEDVKNALDVQTTLGEAKEGFAVTPAT